MELTGRGAKLTQSVQLAGPRFATTVATTQYYNGGSLTKPETEQARQIK